MILRRLATSIRKQDWFAVLIETTIVVFGVYLGIQFGNWNANRQTRELYVQCDSRMMDELRLNLTMVEAVREDMNAPLASVQTAIEELQACREGEEAEARVETAFTHLGRSITIPVETVSIDQLVSNDSFIPFQSPELRTRLLAIARTLRVHAENSRSVADFLGEQTRYNVEGVADSFELLSSDPSEIYRNLTENGGSLSPEMIRRHRLIVPVSVACESKPFTDSFYAWENNVYFQAILADITIGYLERQIVELGVDVADETDAVMEAEQ